MKNIYILNIKLFNKIMKQNNAKKNIIIKTKLNKKIFYEIEIIKFIMIDCFHIDCYSYNKTNNCYYGYKNKFVIFDFQIKNNNKNTVIEINNIQNISKNEYLELKKNLIEAINIICESY